MAFDYSMNSDVDSFISDVRESIENYKVDVKKMPDVVVCDMLFKKLNSTIGAAGYASLVTEIVFNAKINVSQNMLNNHFGQLEELVDIVVGVIVEIFNQLRAEYYPHFPGFVEFIMRKQSVTNPIVIEMDF
jgi:hypothetical protein